MSVKKCRRLQTHFLFLELFLKVSLLRLPLNNFKSFFKEKISDILRQKQE